LFPGQRSEESRGGIRHLFGRLRCGQPFPVLVHDPDYPPAPARAADAPQMRGVRSRIRVADVDVLQQVFRVMLGR
jgi:hypothetical protein